MAPFVPLRYTLPLPAGLADLLAGASLPRFLDDIGVVAFNVSQGAEHLYRMDATLAVREVIDLEFPGLQGGGR